MGWSMGNNDDDDAADYEDDIESQLDYWIDMDGDDDHPWRVDELDDFGDGDVDDA